MVVLKIIGISLAAIIGLIVVLFAIICALRLRLVLFYDGQDKIQFRVKLLCFTFGKKKKEKKQKKPSKLAARFKKKFGLDVFESNNIQGEKQKTGEKVSRIVSLLMLFAGQIRFIFSKIRLDRLYALIICGDGDAADAAMDYGLVCSTVYPMIGYLNANVNSKKGAEDVRIGCDFENDSRIEFEVIISIRIFNLLKAAMGAMNDMAIVAEKTEDNNEQ